MANRVENAINYYKQTYNCAQSLFTAFRDDSKLDETTALKLATIFGAGMACTGNHLCGAVSGALMAISMKYGRGNAKDLAAKSNTYALGSKFMEAFQQKNGCCRCEEILGVNIGTPEGMAQAKQMKMFETKCLAVVKSAAEILDQMLSGPE